MSRYSRYSYWCPRYSRYSYWCPCVECRTRRARVGGRCPECVTFHPFATKDEP